MVEKHQGAVDLKNNFNSAHEWLRTNGEVDLKTSHDTPFSAKADTTNSGDHSGEPVIRFFQRGKEFGRSYQCCWGHYYNCNRTRIGMYCEALDRVI